MLPGYYYTEKPKNRNIILKYTNKKKPIYEMMGRWRDEIAASPIVLNMLLSTCVMWLMWCLRSTVTETGTWSNN
jgi:hypothetical protein